MTTKCEYCDKPADVFIILKGSYAPLSSLLAECNLHYRPDEYTVLYNGSTKITEQEYQLLKVKEHI